MASYEAWFENEDDIGRAAVAILRLMGLFNRPAEAGCLAALRAEPPIPGLTESLFLGERNEVWQRAIERLRAAGLVAEAIGREDTLDTHPLIREHFALQLDEQLSDAAREAHCRLYEHLRDTAPEQPDNLSAMMPLYRAVAHGCQAGLFQQALQVFIRRILRDPNSGYSMRQLGAIAEDLGALSWFCDRQWTEPSAQLDEAEQRWVLNESGVRLVALGRVHEAREALEASRSISRHWSEAHESAGNLSDLERLQGQVSRAISLAQDAVTYSDRGEDQFRRMGARLWLANALSLGGRPQEARKLYEWAERIQTDVSPKYPILYSEQGFRYCELTLMQAERAAWRRIIGSSDAKDGTPHDYQAEADASSDLIHLCADVGERAEQTLAWAQSLDMLREIGLDLITLARSGLYRELLIQSQMADIQSAIANPDSEIQLHADSAVRTLRQSGMSNLLPFGLLCRAWVRSLLGDEEGSEADLAETEKISERGPMPLFLSDVHLYRARLFRDRAELAKAEDLLSKMQEQGYHRRDDELTDALAAAKRW